jgi:hypothetical protein
MSRKLVVTLLAGLVVAFALLLSAAPAEQPADKPKAVISLQVYHPGGSIPGLVQASLFQDGKLIRSRELDWGSNTYDKVTWEKLSPGIYEVHFEAPGYPRSVKRLVLTEDDLALKVSAQLDKQPLVTGAGPSLQELAEEVQRLKAQVRSLRAEVEQLKKK